MNYAEINCVYVIIWALLVVLKSKKLILGCRKWRCNKWGLKGCLAALPGNRPKSAFFGLFRPFPEGAKSTWEIQKTEEKGLFPPISSDFLKPPSLKPPALRHSNNIRFSIRGLGLLQLGASCSCSLWGSLVGLAVTNPWLAG